ncbi:hypothetical protein MHYP_G00242630 [Metynnis hypsauchen]
MDSVMELLLAALLIALSTWIWRRRGLNQPSSTQHNAALLRNGSRSVQGALDQSPATPSAGCSVVLNADHGTSVAAPTLNSNNFYGPSVFSFSTNAADTDLTEASKSEKHSEPSVLKQILETHKANLRKKIKFNSCGLTEQCCETVASALQLPNSPLQELDLSNNSQMDAGAKLLSEGLMSPQCKLEKMSLASCHFSIEQCEVIALAVNSASSPLRELDLSYNDLQDSGVKLLSDGLKTSDSKLEKLRLGWCKLSADS